MAVLRSISPLLVDAHRRNLYGFDLAANVAVHAALDSDRTRTSTTHGAKRRRRYPSFVTINAALTVETVIMGETLCATIGLGAGHRLVGYPDRALLFVPRLRSESLRAVVGKPIAEVVSHPLLERPEYVIQHVDALDLGSQITFACPAIAMTPTVYDRPVADALPRG